MEEKRYLTFALGKGRLANKTLELFEKIGITCEEIYDKNTRKLIFVNEELKLKFFLSKGPDVPTYVEYGAADIGVVGKDTILEEGRKVHEVCGESFLTITPGVRFPEGDVGDQKRVTSPARAKEIGSDYIVVGRPITAAEDPVAAYERCINEFVG